MARPTKLDDLKAQKVINAIAGGNSRHCAAASVGIGVRTLHTWMSEHPQFRQRVMDADAQAEQKVVAALFSLVTDGERPHFEAIKFWLRTRRALTWRELQPSPAKEPETNLDGKSEAELIAAVDAWRAERKKVG